MKNMNNQHNDVNSKVSKGKRLVEFLKVNSEMRIAVARICQNSGVSTGTT